MQQSVIKNAILQRLLNITKNKSNVLLFISVSTALVVLFCSCKEYWCHREPSYYEKYCVFKYNEGEDYSQYVMISDEFKLQPSETIGISRPIALSNDYFLYKITTSDVHTISYLNFTYDELEAGQAPENWELHWQDYVLTDCPFAEYYTAGFSECSEIDGIPGYCPTCSSTYYADTAWLNNTITSGVFFVLKPIKKRL